jgi:ATP-dependent Clp protease ATP-binding subunit ClpX
MKKSDKCDFCNNPKEISGSLIEGASQNVHICENCARESVKIFYQNRNKMIAEKPKEIGIPTPKEVVAHLDQYVVGQDDAKKTLAVAVVNHYKRLLHNDDVANENGVEIDKSNVLILGPTGSGKTLLAQSLAKMLNVPFAIGDATTLTEAGYVGEDVENLLLKLIRAANDDIEWAERGIIYIDEIDKIGKTSQNVSITRDVSGEGVQQALLKMLEGTIANVPPQGGRKHPEQQYLEINTKNILFICGGTFVGLADIIQKRIKKDDIKIKIGFSKEELPTENKEDYDENNILKNVISDDLVKFGLIPELIGRLPVVTPIQELSVETLSKILVEPKNALIKQFQQLCKYDKVTLEFAPDAITRIAELAKENETGARGLRSIIEKIMNPIMYDLSSYSQQIVRVTPEMVNNSVKKPQKAAA